MRRQRGSGVWLPTDREIARLGRARKDAEGYWVWPDGTRLPPIAGGSGPGLANALGAVQGAGSTNPSFSCAAAVPTSQLVIAGAGGDKTTAATSQSIGDNASPTNTYTQAAALAGTGNNGAVLISACNPTTALTTSNTITYTPNGNIQVNNVGAGAFTGCTANAAAHSYASASASAASGAATVTSGTVTGGDLAIFVVDFFHTASATPATPAGWSVVEAPANNSFAIFYTVPSSTGTLSPSTGPIGTAYWAAAIVAFPAASATVPYIIGARNTYH